MIAENITIILTSFFLIQLFYIFIYRRWLNPANFIVFYWLGWLLIAQFSISGLFLPSFNVTFIHVVFIFMFGLGSIVGAVSEHKTTAHRNIIRPDLHFHSSLLVIERTTRFIRNFLWIILPLTLFYTFKALGVLLSGNILNYRAMVVHASTSPVFSTSMNFIYYEIIPAVLYIYMMLLASLFIFKKQKTQILLLIIYVLCLSVIYFNRIYLYWTFWVLFLSYMINYMSGINRYSFFKVKKKSVVFIIAIVLIMISVMSVLRGSKRNLGLDYFMVHYHTAGLILFDIDLVDKNSPLYTKPTYGLGILGGIEKNVILLIRQFQIKLDSIVSRPELGEFKQVGHDKFGNRLKSNAVYNTVYTFYRDAGYLGVMFGGFLMGFLCLRSFQKWMIYRNLLYLTSTIFWAHLMVCSFIRGYFESSYTWGAIIVFGVIIFFYRSNIYLRGPKGLSGFKSKAVVC